MKVNDRMQDLGIGDHFISWYWVIDLQRFSGQGQFFFSLLGVVQLVILLKSVRFLIKLQFHACSSSDTMECMDGCRDLIKKSSYDVGLLGLSTIVHNDIIQ